MGDTRCAAGWRGSRGAATLEKRLDGKVDFTVPHIVMVGRCAPPVAIEERARHRHTHCRSLDRSVGDREASCPGQGDVQRAMLFDLGDEAGAERCRVVILQPDRDHAPLPSLGLVARQARDQLVTPCLASRPKVRIPGRVPGCIDCGYDK